MKSCKLVISLEKGGVKEVDINDELRQSISFCLINIDSMQTSTHTMQDGKHKDVLPKSNYKKVETESQRLLTNQSIAHDVFELLSAMTTPNHTAIYFEY